VIDEAVSRAVLAERERCAKHVRRWEICAMSVGDEDIWRFAIQAIEDGTPWPKYSNSGNDR
jgi:hypothetical protein